MESAFSPKSLTPVITLRTNAPFPVPDDNVTPELVPDGAPPIAGYKPSDTDVVQLRVCSELISYSAPLKAFETSEKLGLVVDGKGQPMALSIGEDRRLRLLFHVNGAPQAWQMLDITPPGVQTALVFDIGSWKNSIYIATAVELADQTKVLYTATFATPTLEFNQNNKSVTPNPDGLIHWNRIDNNLGSKSISSISLSPVRATDAIIRDSGVFKSGFQICVGTSATSTLIGSHYIIDPSPGAATPWRNIPLPEAIKRVIGVQGASRRNEIGSFVLYELADSIGCTLETLDRSVLDASGNWTQAVTNYRILTAIVGAASDMYANTNTDGTTDLFIAGTNGIGYYPVSKITREPTVILPGISFKQVIASEANDQVDTSTRSSVITILGLAHNDELYHIIGRRNLSDSKVTFSASGFPIRTGVSRLSCFYNGVTGASEIVYASSNSSTLRHLIRDQIFGSWNENLIYIPSTGKLSTFPAYATSITCTNDAGQLVPGGYSLSISSPAIKAIINDMAINLNSTPLPLRTDSDGKLNIIIPTDDTLGGPTLKISVTQYVSSPESFTMYPAQRVIRGLAAITTGNDLISAKTAEGTKVFPDLGDSNSGSVRAEEIASVLSNFSSLVQAADPEAAKQVLGVASPPPDNLVVSISQDKKAQASTRLNVISSGWDDFVDGLENVFEVAEEFIDDVVEYVKKAFKKVMKFVFKIVANALEFFVEIGGKILKFAIKAAGPLLKSIVGFMKDYLGIDATGLLEWLGFILDVAEIKKTQRVLQNAVTSSLNITSRFLEKNKSTLQSGFNSVRENLQPVLKDTRRPTSSDIESNDTADILTQISWVIQNPVFRELQKLNPMKILLEAIGEAAAEEFSDLIKLPSMDNLDSILTNTIPKLVTDEIDIIKRFFEDIFDQVQKAATSPADFADRLLGAILNDALWTIFDSTEKISMAMFEILVSLLKQLIGLLTDTIKIPLLTTMFEVVAEQDFSVLNCTTYITAGIMNIVFDAAFDKLPFEVMGDPLSFFQSASDDSLDLSRLLNKALESKQSGMSDISVSDVSISKRPSGSEWKDGNVVASTNANTHDAGYESAKQNYTRGTLFATTINQVFGNMNTQVAILALASSKSVNDAALGRAKGALGIIAAGITTACRVNNLVMFMVYGFQSQTLLDELCDRNYTKLWGSLIGIVCTAGALISNSAGYALRDGTVAPLVSGILLPIGDIAFQICNGFIVPGDAADIFLACVRILLVDISGIAGVCCAPLLKDPEPITKAVVAQGLLVPLAGQAITVVVGIDKLVTSFKKG